MPSHPLRIVCEQPQLHKVHGLSLGLGCKEQVEAQWQMAGEAITIADGKNSRKADTLKKMVLIGPKHT